MNDSSSAEQLIVCALVEKFSRTRAPASESFQRLDPSWISLGPAMKMALIQMDQSPGENRSASGPLDSDDLHFEIPVNSQTEAMSKNQKTGQTWQITAIHSLFHFLIILNTIKWKIWMPLFLQSFVIMWWQMPCLMLLAHPNKY